MLKIPYACSCRQHSVLLIGSSERHIQFEDETVLGLCSIPLKSQTYIYFPEREAVLRYLIGTIGDFLVVNRMVVYG